jgi:hypothetical protein
MALVLADRVKETTTTTGTGTVTLAGVSAGYQSFAAIGNGNTTYYTISGQTTSEWEVGIGTYTSSGTTLSRTTVLSSSTGGSLVNFSAGTKDVFVTYPSGRSVNADAANTVVSVPQLSATSITDSGNLTFTGTGNRITGDFSNATGANRVTFQTSTVDGATDVQAIPNGIGTRAGFIAYNNSSIGSATANTQLLQLSTETRLVAGGSSPLPMTFYAGGSERMRLDTSGNLGIGTTTPSSYGKLGLSVSATASAVTNVIGFQNSAGVDAASLRIAGYNYVNGVQTAIDFIQNSASNFASQMAFSTNTGGGLVERMRIDSSGNVGIGTSSPTTTPKMTVQGGGTNGYGGIRILSDTTYSNGANYQAYGRRSDGNGSGSFAGGVLLARVNTAPAAITSGMNLGRVAFGGSYDGTDANVVYGAQISGYSSGTYSSTSAPTDLVFSTTPSGTAGGTTTGVSDFGSERMRIDNAGNIRLGDGAVATNTLRFFDIYNSDAGASAGAIIRLVTSNVAASGNTTVDLVKYKSGGFILNNNDTNAAVFTAFGVGASERMRIDSSGNAIVGATSTYGARLGVVGTASGSNNYIQITNPGIGTACIGLTSTSSNVRVYNSYATGVLASGVGIDIDTSGNVGIGNSSPTAKLDVTGGIKVSGQLMAGTSGSVYAPIVSAGYVAGTSNLYLRNLGGTNRIDSYNDPITATYPLQINASTMSFQIADSTKATLDSSGNVGIGTTLPSTRLSVVSATNGGISVNDGTVNTIIYNSTGGVASIGTTTNHPVDFYSNNAARMRIDSSGNVGIGTSGPSAKLDVVTSINLGLNYLNVAYDIGGGAGWLGGYNVTYSGGVKNVNTGTLSSIAYQGDSVVFYTNTSTSAGTAAPERVRIDGSGNLLVGQTSAGFVNLNSLSSVVGSGGGTQYINHASGAANGTAYALFGYNGAGIGSITQSGTTAVLYNTTSDQRLKENIQDADSASAMIDALQVRQFDWKSDNTHQRYGFVAQELVTVAPEAVHQPADPEEMMAVDYSKLVPMLVKEIQSLRKRLTALEST